MFPPELAAHLAITETLTFLRQNPEFERILLMAYSAPSAQVLRDALPNTSDAPQQ